MAAGQKLNKKALWEQVTEEMAERIDPGMFFMLRHDGYLDSLELNFVNLCPACRAECFA